MVLPLLRQTKMTEEDIRKESPSEEVVLQEGKIKERADITLKETARIRCVIIGIPPVCQHHKTDSGCKFGDKCVFRHTEDDSQPSKKQKKSGGKEFVALLKNSKQLGCAFQDFELPKSKSTTLRKNTRKKGSIER